MTLTKKRIARAGGLTALAGFGAAALVPGSVGAAGPEDQKGTIDGGAGDCGGTKICLFENPNFNATGPGLPPSGCLVQYGSSNPTFGDDGYDCHPGGMNNRYSSAINHKGKDVMLCGTSGYQGAYVAGYSEPILVPGEGRAQLVNDDDAESLIYNPANGNYSCK